MLRVIRGVDCALFLFHSKGVDRMQQESTPKKRRKIKVADNHCRNCVWFDLQKLCAFERCVRHFGFIADKKVMK